MKLSKTCSRCKIEKDRCEFYTDNSKPDKLRHECKACNAAYEAARYAANPEKKRARVAAWQKDTHTVQKELQARFANTPCMDCGAVWPYAVMDFDHRLPSEKSFEISSKNIRKATPENMAIVESELAKCDYVDATCHRIREELRRMAHVFQKERKDLGRVHRGT